MRMQKRGTRRARGTVCFFRLWSCDTLCILFASGADAKHEASQWLGAAAPFVGLVVCFQNDVRFIEVLSNPSNRFANTQIHTKSIGK